MTFNTLLVPYSLETVTLFSTPLRGVNHLFSQGALSMNYKNNGAASHKPSLPKEHFLRFHLPHIHLASVFGDNWFALKAEAFARFFGTPFFIVAQTIIVVLWIGANVAGFTNFDLYPFILLNLAFSLQAAYAAPLILLAQTRQADRDKMHTAADAEHRESLAMASEQRELLANQQITQLAELLKQNTKLTEITNDLTIRIETLTKEIHNKFLLNS